MRDLFRFNSEISTSNQLHGTNFVTKFPTTATRTVHYWATWHSPISFLYNLSITTSPSHLHLIPQVFWLNIWLLYNWHAFSLISTTHHVVNSTNYKFPLSNFLQPPILSSPLRPRYFPQYLFVNTFNVRSFLKLTDQLSHPHITDCIFTSLHNKQGD
jgi:hypothetical protein